MDVKNLRARDIMRTDVKTIEKSAPLSQAANMMREFGVSSLIVEPEGDWDAIGIVTRKDILEALIDDSIGRIGTLVGDVMSKPTITVTPNLSIYNCHLMMRMAAVRRLPVMDGERLVGILSNSDILHRLCGE
jgi:CBS domain-containing protein